MVGEKVVAMRVQKMWERVGRYDLVACSALLAFWLLAGIELWVVA